MYKEARDPVVKVVAQMDRGAGELYRRFVMPELTGLRPSLEA
jgi:hypothetical protein